MQAPLGRAVIGGLVMSTFATLLVVPSIFAVVIGRKVARSPSMYPGRPRAARTTTRRSSPTRRPRPADEHDRRSRGGARPTATDANPTQRSTRRLDSLGPAELPRQDPHWRRSGCRLASAPPAAVLGPRSPLVALAPAAAAHRLQTKAEINTRLGAPDRTADPAATVRTIVRVVGQPSFIEAYERTSIYPKLTAYIEKWIVDIGDKVKKDQVLATLFVPELVEDYETKKATVELDKERIELARKMVEVADAERQGGQGAASPRPRRSWPSTRPRSTAGTRRSSGSRREVKRGVVDPQILLESTRPVEVEHRLAGRGQGDHQDRRRRNCSPNRPRLEKAKVDVEVAQADLAVAESESRGSRRGSATSRSPRPSMA